jgi:hypothetical protein
MCRPRRTVPIIGHVRVGIDHSWNTIEAAEIDDRSVGWNAAICRNTRDLVILYNDDCVVDDVTTSPEFSKLDHLRRGHSVARYSQ